MGNRLARLAAIGAGVALALTGLIVWIERPPAPARLLAGVDDDTLGWTSNPLGVVRWQRSLGADAVRVWVPWRGEREPRLTELRRASYTCRP